MLQKISISNYAIIEEITVVFSKKLNIITGETGAGKSILIGALGLILGERAESNVLLNKEKKSVIEASFAVDSTNIQDFLKENELDITEELIVRREITPNGKSRAFVNDTPVNLSQLKLLSNQLVDLHQQFDTQELGSNNFQREILDALAGNHELLQQYSIGFKKYKILKSEIEALVLQQKQANETLDYNRFLFDELDELSLKENELEQLDEELKLLSHAEEVKQELNGIYFELKESEQPLLQQLKSLASKLNYLKQYHSSAKDLGDRLHSLQVELDDIATSIDDLNSSVKFSPERMQLVNDRLSAGYRLIKKHNVQTTAQLLTVKEELQRKLDCVLNITDTIAVKDKEASELLNTCNHLAEKISANRQKTIKPFTEKVNVLLKQIGMSNAQLKVQLATMEMGEFGADEIQYLFDANKTGHFEILGKVASGGELSRLMLCIKSIVAKKLQLPTLIFDEIDTGISGEAAKQVGVIMKELSGNHQVISITHQPQIAAKADAHYFVYKEMKLNKINTSVKLLNSEERVAAIAQMIGGEKPTEAAMRNAKEMVG